MSAPGNLALFVPAWADEAGLTPIQFRVLAHLWRRAGKKRRCWPAAPSIRKTCRISNDAFWAAIKVLEARGFLRREKRRYNSNEYILLLPDVTPENRVTLLPQETGEQSPTETGEPSPGTDGCKGMKGKSGKEGSEKKGGGLVPPDLVSFPWQTLDDLPDQLRQTLAGSYPDPADQADVFAEIAGREAAYFGTKAGTKPLAAWTALFAQRVRECDVADNKQRRGSATWCQGGRRRLKINEDIRSPQPTGEPERWQEWLDAKRPNSEHSCGGLCFGPWKSKDRAAQDWIRREMEKEPLDAAGGVPWEETKPATG